MRLCGPRIRRTAARIARSAYSLGTLDWRADPQNLPAGLTVPWPIGFASMGGSDHDSAYVERGEIYDLVRDARITGFAIVSGDRHSFWAGYAAKALPPKPFEPFGLSLVPQLEAWLLGQPVVVSGRAHSLPHRLCSTKPVARAEAGEEGGPSPSCHRPSG